MSRTITITDTTLRDGQQSLWAFRMRTEWMLPVLERQEMSRVETVDVAGTAHFVAMVRFLQEDPWERLRAFRRLLTRPMLESSGAGDTIGSFNLAPRDVRQLFNEVCIRSGIDVIRGIHGLFDTSRMAENLKVAKEAGAQTMACLVFGESPVHTDALYEAKAREIVAEAGVDWIMIKDSGGLLTPERTGSLVDAVRRGAGRAKVTLHSHCNAGMAHRVYMIGAEHGVDDLQCSIWPLALGTAQPSMQTVVRNLREMGYSVGVDDRQIDAASRYLQELARRQGLPVGEAMEYDHLHYSHQIPGGMWSNLVVQLKEAGLTDRLPELLQETARVRSDLGWPTMVTPYSQFVANQALLNIVTGERYGSVPDQVKMYVLGYYGAPLAPLDQNALDRIVANGSPAIGEYCGEVAPALPELRKHNPGASDEELLLRYMCSDHEVETLLKRRRTPDARGFWADGEGQNGRRSQQLVALLAQLAGTRDVESLTVDKGSLHLRVVK